MYIRLDDYDKHQRTSKRHSTTVTILDIFINSQGQFKTKDKLEWLDSSMTSKPILKIDPDNKKSASVTRSLIVPEEHPTYAWTSVEVFKDTEENRAKLWELYDEIRQVFSNKNDEHLYKLTQLAFEESKYHREEENIQEYFAFIVDYVWKFDDFSVLPINKEDYELKIYADGRLFRFVKKGTFINSPIQYRYNKRETTYDFTFYIIDGSLHIAFLW